MPASENGGTIPRYQEIADHLRQAIVSGRLSDGDRVPGENDLMREHGIARATARQALSVLIHEGLVVAVRGSGIYVRAFRPLRRHGARRLSRQLWGEGRAIWQADAGERTYEVDRITVQEIVAPDFVARALDLGVEDRVVERRRRYRLDTRPVQLAASYIPAKLAAGSAMAEENPGPGGIYARLAELGQAPVHFTEEIRARMPTPTETADLELPRGTPVVDVVRTAITAEHRAVELSELTLDSSAYVMQYDFES